MRHVGTAAYWVSYVILATILVMAIVPTLETRLFPVYSKFSVLDAKQSENGVTAIFTFRKLRNCEPRGLSWFIGEVGSSTSVNASIRTDANGPRPLGPNTSSPYLIEGITLEDLHTRLIAQIRSNCSVFGIPQPWTTVSEVYP